MFVSKLFIHFVIQSIVFKKKKLYVNENYYKVKNILKITTLSILDNLIKKFT